MVAQSQSEVLKQLGQAWDQAQRQLVELRTQVEQTAAMATAKVNLNALERDLDRAYRDLGEAIWQQVQAGRVKLPSGVSALQKAVEVVQQRIEDENAGLRDLLAEGNEAASRLKPRSRTSSKTAVAQTKGKR